MGPEIKHRYMIELDPVVDKWAVYVSDPDQWHTRWLWPGEPVWHDTFEEAVDHLRSLSPANT